MKKFNFLYFGCMTLLWPVVDRLLSLLTPHHPTWLLLLPAYCCWYLLSAPFLYWRVKRKGPKEGFLSACCMRAQWATVWIDVSHNELAYLCMWNPFRVRYLPLDAVGNAGVEAHYSGNQELISYVNLKFMLNGKQNKIRVDTGGRGRRFYAQTNGKELVERVREFAEVLNGDMDSTVIDE